MANQPMSLTELNAEKFSTQDSFQTISAKSSSSAINIPQNYQVHSQFQEKNEYLEKVFDRYLVKVKNNESTFQIFRPKGDLQLPNSEEEETNEDEEIMKKKFKIYQKLLKPLKGQSLYSINTLKLKLEIDLLMLEQFNSNDFSL